MKRYNKKRIMKKIKLIKKYELQNIFIKFLIHNQKEYNSKLFLLLNNDLYKKQKKNSSIVRFQTRCIITNSKHSVSRKFKLTRMKLKEIGLDGILTGLRKASW